MSNCKIGKNGKFLGVVWTEAMLDRLRSDFPTMLNSDVALELGVSKRTMIRKARELGLVKCDDFRSINGAAIRRRASMSLRGRPNAGWFRKGEHACSEREFVKGHPPLSGDRETARRKRMSEARLDLVAEERVRMKYGLPRRSKLKLR